MQRCVIGATSGAPVVIDDAHFISNGASDESVRERLSATALSDDAFLMRTRAVVLRRALAKARM